MDGVGVTELLKQEMRGWRWKRKKRTKDRFGPRVGDPGDHNVPLSLRSHSPRDSSPTLQPCMF